jgi:hypothetical protein
MCCRQWPLKHTVGQAEANSSLVDVGAALAMLDWAQFRYVAHVDGITCSCRLEKLLAALGSLLVKEESGYMWGRCWRTLQVGCGVWCRWQAQGQGQGGRCCCASTCLLRIPRTAFHPC